MACATVADTMQDLINRADIERLVDAFYARVGDDAVLGPIFNDVARVDWDTHLPRMYQFWDSVLFGTAGYKGNPLAVHRELAEQTRLTPEHFNHWLDLFSETVDALFAGPTADHAKLRASRIAATLVHHLAAGPPFATFAR